MESKPVIIIQGGQFGSEAKGAVAAALCIERNVDYAVRTGAVNAGHTVYYKGKAFKMQQLPTGWVSPSTKLVIGAGALVNPDILADEIYDVRQQLQNGHPIVYVDRRAGLHTSEHTKRSAASGRHYSMGATGKGCSEALVDRVRLRGKGGRLYNDWCLENAGPNLQFVFTDTEEMLNEAYDNGHQILLEGTQGSLLDLYLGPYPFTTHKPTQSATWIQECGLSPNLKYEIALVVRTYPIRVAGNSGPMEAETDWVTLAVEINNALTVAKKPPLVSARALVNFTEACIVAAGTFPDMPKDVSGFPRYDFHRWPQELRTKHKEALSELHAKAFSILNSETRTELKKLFEFTTVTSKLRRVARFDMDNLRKAVRWNRPNYLVLTFLNYAFPECWGATSLSDVPKEYEKAVKDIEDGCGVPVRYVTTGPLTENILERPDWNRRELYAKAGH